MSWAGVIGAVATGLAAAPMSGAAEMSRQESLLSALAAAAPPLLRHRLALMSARDDAANDAIEPVIYQNELPVRLLADGIVTAAVREVAGWRAGLADGTAEVLGGDNQTPDAIVAIVAVAALSTLRLELADCGTALDGVRRRLDAFDADEWAEALRSLTGRTRELHGLLVAAGGDRRHVWSGVSVDDRILAEAVAAAVVGGAASDSGVLPHHWLFPFHVFCRVGVSAAEAALATIEAWLGIGFPPPPHTAERTAGLAALVAAEAASLWQGCCCKQGLDPANLAFAQRGPCRQPDHDLRVWRPGEPKPGSRAGARFASTLWGWLRRWLGGPDAGRAANGGYLTRPRLQPNDVAGCVLRRRWLSSGRGTDGPVLLFDRILPEFCLRCGTRARVASGTQEGDAASARRAACCTKPELVYQAEFSERAGVRLATPRLGLVVASPSAQSGQAGYRSTAPLGDLWLCRTSGRYSLSGEFCLDCGPHARDDHHEFVRHGWVLLPLGQAWKDLESTVWPDGSEEPAAAAVTEEDLRYLAEAIGELSGEIPVEFRSPAEVVDATRSWSLKEMQAFADRCGQHGLELLLRCKNIAEAGGARP